MKAVPAICFAFATAIAGTLLPISSSYADEYPADGQSCDSGSASSDAASSCGDREHKPDEKADQKDNKLQKN
jgi:hypothetical protein